jgi:hypothetical protein
MVSIVGLAGGGPGGSIGGSICCSIGLISSSGLVGDVIA